VKGISFLGVPAAFRYFFGGAVWECRTDKKEIFLTFDDGPSPEVTLKALDILDEFGAKATFFCIGRNVERHPEIYRAVVEAGHATGNHTYSHVKGWYTANKSYYDDIELASGLIDSTLFRPPYGLLTPLQSRHLQKDYKIIINPLGQLLTFS